jgi:hypothetical protein
MRERTTSTEVNVPPKSKCGRKPKILTSSTDKLDDNIDTSTQANALNSSKNSDETDFVKIKKKCGRKPKSGKIVHKVVNSSTTVVSIPNIILELNCLMEDTNSIENPNVVGYDFISKPDTTRRVSPLTITYDQSADNDKKLNVQNNLKKLQATLQLANADMDAAINSSACFWCTFEFLSEPVYIPKSVHNDKYCVYGCFCSPECAAGFLLNETLDSTVKFERYHLLNHIYYDIFEYSKNIKPAPNPFYTLKKFCGNLSIEQYRTLHKSDQILITVNKPLTRIMPEVHVDNGEFIINNKLLQKKKPIGSSIPSMFGKRDGALS